MHAAVPALDDRAGRAWTDARPAPGVLEAIADADVVLLPPSNPVVSIGTILAVPGIRDALAATAAPVVGVSPIIGGAPVRGMADACLAAIGVETSRRGGRRGSTPGLLDGWLVDDADAGTQRGRRRRARAAALHDRRGATAAIAAAALDLAAELRVPA